MAKSTNVTIRMRPALLDMVRQHARARATSPNQVVVDAVERYIGEKVGSPFLRIHRAASDAGIKKAPHASTRFAREELHEDS